MEHRQNRLSRLGPFLERGLHYAAQTLAGREGGAWPTSVTRRGASMPESADAAGPGAPAESRPMVTPLAAWRARHRGVPTR